MKQAACLVLLAFAAPLTNAAPDRARISVFGEQKPVLTFVNADRPTTNNLDQASLGFGAQSTASDAVYHIEGGWQ